MSNVGTVIYGLLSTDTNLASEIGTKIYPNMAPQGKDKPRGSYIVYNTMVSSRTQTQGNVGRYYKVAVSVYSSSYKRSTEISDFVIQRLHRFGGASVGSQRVTAIFYQEEADDVIDDPQLHHKASEFEVILPD